MSVVAAGPESRFTKHARNFVRNGFTFVLSLVKVLLHSQPKPPPASACICNDGDAGFHLERSKNTVIRCHSAPMCAASKLKSSVFQESSSACLERRASAAD